MNKLKKIVWQSLNAMQLGGAVQLMLKSALTENGWFRSFHAKQSVNQHGHPIPWCTYPFIQFIEPRLHQQMDVFEFGCGNSTFWYATKVRSIKAIEHDEVWVASMRPKLPANAQVAFRKLTEDDQYPKEVRSEGKPYHIIIIDGRKRNRCAKQAVNCLTADGVIVWDNSNLAHYQTGVTELAAHFKRIDFWGMSPITSHLNCTTIFYKSENCLNI